MAHSSRSRSSASSRRPARGGGRPGAGPSRGGGNNTTLTVVAILLIGGVIGAVVILGGDKKKPTNNTTPVELTANSNVGREATPKPAKPTRSPPPPLSDAVKERAKSVAADIDGERKLGDALYDDAMRAKEKGDTDLWQKKLKEAARHFNAIKDRWNNEIIDSIMEEIPQSSDWDAEEVANHYLGKEGQLIAKALEKLAYIKKQIRLDE